MIQLVVRVAVHPTSPQQMHASGVWPMPDIASEISGVKPAVVSKQVLIIILYFSYT